MSASVYARQERIATSNHDVIKVTLDWNHKIVTAALSNSEWVQSVKWLMDSVWWVSAINWAFFCPAESEYSRCDAGISDFIRIENGNLYSLYWEDIWAWRSLFWFDYNWKPLASERDPDKESWVNKYRYHEDVPKYEYGISMYTILFEWEDRSMNWTMTNDSKQKLANDKMFICSTADRNVVYFGTIKRKPFGEMWAYLKNNFGCYNANLLDGGWSRALIYNNQHIIWPGRQVKDAFVVVETNWTQYDWNSQDEIVEPVSYTPVTKWEEFGIAIIKSLNRSDNTWMECRDYVQEITRRLYEIEDLVRVKDQRMADMLLSARRYISKNDIFYFANNMFSNEWHNWPKTTPRSERQYAQPEW